MLIAVWGRDGIGKSTLCDTLGCLFAKENITVVIYTDLTQPTLPARIIGQHFDTDTSLGKAISGIGIGNISRYLHQHKRKKSLFYAGLTAQDEYLSYEVGLEADNVAQDFVEQCLEYVDTVILDLSGQRTDSFLPGALVHADKFIVMFTPDVEGVCWFNSVKQLLQNMNANERVLPVITKMDKYTDLSAIEKAVDMKFAAILPYTKELHRLRDTGISPLEGASRYAQLYIKQVKNLYAKLKENRNE